MIDINIPVGQTHWGPGVGFFWERREGTPLGGPFRIEITVGSVDPSSRIWTHIEPSRPDIRGYLNIGYGEGNVIETFDFQATVKEEAPVALTVNAFTQDEAIVDTGSRTLPWAQTVALHNELALTRSTGTVQGGFTATDRAEAAETQANTNVSIPVLGGIGDFVRTLADWTTLSHGTVLTRGPVILLSGRGTLPIEVFQGRGVPFGAFFTWHTVPAELGFLDGVVLHYARALFEVSTIYADFGLSEYRQDLKEFHEDGYFWDWLGKVPPERIDYFVLPGVVVAWQWMYTKPG